MISHNIKTECLISCRSPSCYQNSSDLLNYLSPRQLQLLIKVQLYLCIYYSLLYCLLLDLLIIGIFSSGKYRHIQLHLHPKNVQLNAMTWKGTTSSMLRHSHFRSAFYEIPRQDSYSGWYNTISAQAAQ